MKITLTGFRQNSWHNSFDSEVQSNSVDKDSLFNNYGQFNPYANKR